MADRGTFRSFAIIIDKDRQMSPIVELMQPVSYVKSKTKIPRIRMHDPILDVMMYYDVLGIDTNFAQETLHYTLRVVEQTEENNQDVEEAQHEASSNSVALQGEAP